MPYHEQETRFFLTDRVQLDHMPQPLPVGVLEAKRAGEDPLKGMQQAKGYADCLRFDAKYVFATNGHLYGQFDFFTNQTLGLDDDANDDGSGAFACFLSEHSTCKKCTYCGCPMGASSS